MRGQVHDPLSFRDGNVCFRVVDSLELVLRRETATLRIRSCSPGGDGLRCGGGGLCFLQRRNWTGTRRWRDGTFATFLLIARWRRESGAGRERCEGFPCRDSWGGGRLRSASVR